MPEPTDEKFTAFQIVQDDKTVRMVQCGSGALTPNQLVLRYTRNKILKGIKKARIIGLLNAVPIDIERVRPGMELTGDQGISETYDLTGSEPVLVDN